MSKHIVVAAFLAQLLTQFSNASSYEPDPDFEFRGQPRNYITLLRNLIR